MLKKTPLFFPVHLCRAAPPLFFSPLSILMYDKALRPTMGRTNMNFSPLFFRRRRVSSALSFFFPIPFSSSAPKPYNLSTPYRLMDKGSFFFLLTSELGQGFKNFPPLLFLSLRSPFASCCLSPRYEYKSPLLFPPPLFPLTAIQKRGRTSGAPPFFFSLLSSPSENLSTTCPVISPKEGVDFPLSFHCRSRRVDC